VLFVSDEDLAGDESMLERWTREVPVVAMTESWKGARVHGDGAWRRMDAFPEAEVDPTGAGDTFATALLVRLRETGDVYEAARFGAAAASISVGGMAAESIATREQIDERLRAYPEVALR
jgi:sugar/nucleoside kinase (ribokinase family)